MVALVIVTVCPEVIDTESKFISLAEVPTVKPVMISTPLLSRMRAAAAVPVLFSLVSDFGKPDNVRTPPDAAAALGSLKVISAKMLAMLVVPICKTPAAEPASI
jgi:hypothetical protein